MVKPGASAGKAPAAASLLVLSTLCALSLIGCFGDPEAPAADTFQVDLFGTGDTMVYFGDTARFSVRLAPKINDVVAYSWILSRNFSDSVFDSVETTDPSYSRTWPVSQTGWYQIRVEFRAKSQYWMQPFAFKIRVDSGTPKVELDTAYTYPFGGSNRFKVKARDPNGTVVKYFWSTRQDFFTDSTDGPEWTLPDTLLDYASVYCRVRDDRGTYSRTESKSIRVLPRTYGTVQDGFNALAALPDGGFLAAGQTASFDSHLGEPWIARLDAQGVMVSRTTVKHSSDFGVYGQGSFQSLSPAPGLGFVAAGIYRDSTHDDGVIAGLDGQGGLAWKVFLGDSGIQAFNASVQADAGRHLVVGYSFPDARKRDTSLGLLTAVNAAGQVLYTKTFRRGGRGLDFQTIAKTQDGNVLVAGSGTTGAFSNQSTGFLYKLSPAGDSIWAKSIDLPGLVWNRPGTLVSCRTGGFALLTHATGQSLLVRLNEEGAVVWTKVLIRLDDNGARYSSLLETSAGDFLVGLDLPIKSQPSGVQVIKLDANGTLRWSRSLGDYFDDLHALAESPSGGFAAAGTFNGIISAPNSISTAWAFRFDALGKMLW